MAGLAPLLAALAFVFGATAAPAAARAADLVRAEEIVQSSCFLCHGAAGESSSPVFPRLAGQNAGYIARQLADFKSGRRQSGTMQPMVENLSADDFDALGAFFAAQPGRVHAVENSDLAQAGGAVYLRGNPDSGVAACASCHGPKALGSDLLPRLAGQHAAYTENQLRQFGRRERGGDTMHAIASKLSEREMKAVAAYLAALQ